MRQSFYILSWVTLLSTMGLLITLIYWHTYPYHVADFKNPMKVVNENREVLRGERLRYVLDYCKHTDVVPELTKFLIDGVIYEMPKIPGVAMKGCGEAVADVYIPKAIPPGKYTLKTVARYKVNPIRTIEIINISEPFTVK